MARNMKLLLSFLASLLLIQHFSEASENKQRQKYVSFNVAEEHEVDVNTEIPSVQQIIKENGDIKFSMVKVLKCADSAYKSKQIMKGKTKPDTTRVLDPAYKQYMDQYGTEFVEFSGVVTRSQGSSSSGSKTMVEQVITHSKGYKKQYVDLILDCPRWCKTPITFRQTLTPPFITNGIQTITARFICEKGNQPEVTVIQNSGEKNKQEVRTYVFYKKTFAKSNSRGKYVSPSVHDEDDEPVDNDFEDDRYGLERSVEEAKGSAEPDAEQEESEEFEDYDEVVRPRRKFVSEDDRESGQTDEFEEEREVAKKNLPSISQTLKHIQINGKMSLVKIFKCCSSGKKLDQKLHDGSSSKTSIIVDDARNYLNSNKFRRETVKYSAQQVFNPLLSQTIELCGKNVSQTSVLILDCPDWCKKTIAVSQSIQLSPGNINQSAELYVVCPKGDNPVITRAVNKQRAPNAKIDFKAYVLRSK